MMLDKIYASVISARNLLYDSGILKSYLTPPVVVCIGNIEAGGTGKTPFTMALGLKLKDKGHNVAVVTRGYRGRLDGPVKVMDFHDYRDVGDEPLLMAVKTGLPVIKSPDRLKGATFAYRNLGTDVVLLDDGFQHRRIFRDLNICIISDGVEKQKMLPLGRLREPLSQLKRADFVINATKDTSLEINGLVDSHLKPVDKKLEGRVFAFCGIANPERFFDVIRPFCTELKTLTFRDHHIYKNTDIKKIMSLARGFDMIITTEKDMVRLKPEWLDNRIYALSIEIKINQIESIIMEIEKIVKDRRISRQG